jgi:hypothetical protein
MRNPITPCPIRFSQIQAVLARGKEPSRGSGSELAVLSTFFARPEGLDLGLLQPFVYFFAASGSIGPQAAKFLFDLGEFHGLLVMNVFAKATEKGFPAIVDVAAATQFEQNRIFRFQPFFKFLAH